MLHDRVSLGGCGEIGRHARFRFWWRKPWEFKSLHPHQDAGKRPLNSALWSSRRDHGLAIAL